MGDYATCFGVDVLLGVVALRLALGKYEIFDYSKREENVIMKIACIFLQFFPPPLLLHAVSCSLSYSLCSFPNSELATLPELQQNLQI